MNVWYDIEWALDEGCQSLYEVIENNRTRNGDQFAERLRELLSTELPGSRTDA